MAGDQCPVLLPGVDHRLAACGGHGQDHRLPSDDILIHRQRGDHRWRLDGQGGDITEHAARRVGDDHLVFAGGSLGEACQGQGCCGAAVDILPGVFPLVSDRVSARDRDFEDNTAADDSAGARWLYPDGDGLNHAHQDVITGHFAGETAHLDRIIPGIGVLHVFQSQRGSRCAVNQVAVSPPLIG